MAPHVMDYPEIVKAAKSGQIIYEELKGQNQIRPLRFDGIDFINVRKGTPCYLLLMECDDEYCMDYNWNYRCWNEEPSLELMKSTPWKDNPYA